MVITWFHTEKQKIEARVSPAYLHSTRLRRSLGRFSGDQVNFLFKKSQLTQGLEFTQIQAIQALDTITNHFVFDLCFSLNQEKILGCFKF